MTARTDPRAMVAEPIRSARLDLSPLRPTDAEEVVGVHQPWLNRVARVRDDGGSQPVGTVQATVTADDPGTPGTEVAVLTRVADAVLVHHSELLRNNTVVGLGPTGVLVVDPGITDDEMACLAADLRELGLPVVAGFSTHPDWDHVLWHPDLGDVPRYGTQTCADRMSTLRSGEDWQARVTGGGRR